LTAESPLPLVTLAIPLYRSARFLEIITENIRNAKYPNLEILVGDRHLADDTVDQLRARFSGDSRLRFITSRDEISWVEHYNLLLTEGRGEYFLWMPHDDSYPAGYIGALVDRLEAAPDAILAFGWCDTAGVDGKPYKLWPAPPFSPDDEWSPQTALRMFFGWNIGVAMRGVFRRQRVVDAQLWLPNTTGNAYADVCWLFGVALLGRFEFVPETRCLKRFYPESTHTGWKAPKARELPRLMAEYLDAYVPSRRRRVTAKTWLWVGALINRIVLVANTVTRRTAISEEALRGAFRRILR
jgi:glycosyltransferase involved in cell wall biosynthesis